MFFSRKQLVGVTAAVAIVAAAAAVNEPDVAGQPPQVQTSFGVVRVDAAEIIAGVPKGGHDHNSAGLHGGDGIAVEPGEHLVRVALTIQNSADRVVVYSPAQVVLHIGGEEQAGRLVGASTASGTLPPGSQMSVSLSFAAPEEVDRLRLAYRNEDGSLTEPINIDTEAVDDMRFDAPGPPQENDEHSHVHPQP